MNRNRKKLSEELFLKILEKGLREDPDFPLSLDGRWIEKLNDADATFMSKAEVEILRLSSSRVAAKMTHEDLSVFAISGFSVCDEIPEGLSERDATPGTFALFALQADLEVTGSAAEIRNLTELVSEAHPPYIGHELNQVMPIFPDIIFFEIDKAFDYTNHLDRLVGSYCAKTVSQSGMHLSSNTQIEISKMFETGADEIPYHVLLRGLLSASPQVLFLDLYRCIEQLYSVPRLGELQKALRHSASIYDLSRVLEETISWRPKEDEALFQLFTGITTDHCKAIRSHFGDIESIENTKSAERAAKRIYRLRNENVHFRPAMTGDELSEETWDAVICTMLSVVSDLYDIHGKTYHSAAAV